MKIEAHSGDLEISELIGGIDAKCVVRIDGAEVLLTPDECVQAAVELIRLAGLDLRPAVRVLNAFGLSMTLEQMLEIE